MADKRYSQFQFGFLNTAQDPTDIADTEGSDVSNLDPDQLALGSLQRGDFDTLSSSSRDYLETTMGGRRFFLGDIDYETEYELNSYAFTDQVFSFPSDSRGYTVAWRAKSSNQLSGRGFVLGNSISAGTQVEGGFSVNIDAGGDLELGYWNGAAWTVVNSGVNGFTDDTYHDFVIIYSQKDASNDNIKFYADGVVVIDVDRPAPVTTAIQANQLYIGGTATANYTRFFKEVIATDFACTLPNNWDGTVSSLGVNSGGTVLFSTPKGDFSDDREDITTNEVGTINTTYTRTKQVGPLRYETNPNGMTQESEPYTIFDYKGGTGNATEVTDSEFVFDADYLIAMDFEYDVSDTNCSFFSDGDSTLTAATETFTVGYDHNNAELYVALGGAVASTDPSVIAAVAFPGKKRTRVVLLNRKISDSSFSMSVFMNGALVATYTSSTAIGAYGLGKYLGFFVGVYSGGASPAAVVNAYNYVYGKFKNPVTAFDISNVSGWDGSTNYFDSSINRSFSSIDGKFDPSEEGINISPVNISEGFYVASTSTLVPDIESPLVAGNYSPPTPDKPSNIDTSQYLEISNEVVSSTLTTDPTVDMPSGKGYIGPQSLTFKYQLTWSGSATDPLQIAFDYGTGAFGAASQFGDSATYNGTDEVFHLLDNNLRVNVSGTFVAASHSYEVTVSSSVLLDGEYSYKLVAVKTFDTDPRASIHSTPSEPITVSLKNIDEAGERVANLVPVLTVPPAINARPDGVDRIDIYRKDPDNVDYVKIAEKTGSQETLFTDGLAIAELPRVEFLDENRDETFDTINAAIGNDSGTYDKVFNKDNRLFLIPTDRKDLLLYSRANDWWGWNRESSFAFNGDITDVVVLRDELNIERTVTLVVMTTKGIYHITGEGDEANPYVVVPVIGTDDFTNLGVQPDSAVNANGTIMMMSKSSDGDYDTGPYGQKIYEYDLQKVTEVSGRIRSNPILEGSGNVEYANLIGGDKYIIKLDDDTDGLVYHRDARGWVIFNSDASWSWKSKRFMTSRASRTSPANAKAFKIDYEGTLTLTFTFQRLGGTTNSVAINLTSAGRITMENVLPAGMGEGWDFQIDGQDSSAIVHNFWFVQ